VGREHVADACLLGLAIERRGVLVTLDERLAALIPTRSSERKALEIIA
jgi:hypothetical protein